MSVFGFAVKTLELVLGAKLWKVEKRLVSPNSLYALVEPLVWKKIIMQFTRGRLSFLVIGPTTQDAGRINYVCISDDKLGYHIS